jgi:acyl carrier protein
MDVTETKSSTPAHDLGGEVRQSVRQYIAETLLMAAGADALGDDTSLLRRSVIDSTGVLELVSFLEERFGISIDDAEMVPANLDSLNRIAAFVSMKLERR